MIARLGEFEWDGPHLRSTGYQGSSPSPLADVSGRCWNMIYSSDGKLTALVEPGGSRATFVYDRLGHPRRIELPGGIATMTLDRFFTSVTSSPASPATPHCLSQFNGAKPAPPEFHLPHVCRVPLLLLKIGYDHARQMGNDLWKFSSSISLLNFIGLPNNELVRLVEAGLVRCREFDPLVHAWSSAPGSASCSDHEYVILTDVGAEFAAKIFTESPIRPSYSADRGAIFLELFLVKEFQNSAPGQELILEEFERLGWQACIVNAQRFVRGKNRKVGLKDVVKKLNKNHRVPLIHFECRRGSIGWRFQISRSPGPSEAPE